MKAKLILMIGLVTLTACTDSKKESEVATIQQDIKQSIAVMKQYQEAFKLESEVNEKLIKELDPDGKTVQMWHKALASCESIDTPKCSALRKSYEGLQTVVSKHASLILDSANASE